MWVKSVKVAFGTMDMLKLMFLKNKSRSWTPNLRAGVIKRQR